MYKKTVEEIRKESQKGMKITCSRCRESNTYVQWVDNKKCKWLTMTLCVQSVIHQVGWKTINRCYVCPNCLTEQEKQTDYSKGWYDEIYNLWKENKES
jgi:hypothetical protein